jgi:uncharacterized RDD family membrane protein YckC
MTEINDKYKDNGEINSLSRRVLWYLVDAFCFVAIVYILATGFYFLFGVINLLVLGHPATGIANLPLEIAIIAFSFMLTIQIIDDQMS